MTQRNLDKRVFWLGMHKVLKPTELRRLRDLGYEVFNPAYISDIYDQSADTTIDATQPTTLPPKIFELLIKHNFFYTAIPADVAEILNDYFDAVIVTINPDWLKSIVDVYRGTIIYRVYGQPSLLSMYLEGSQLRRSLISRENFHVVPFASESIESEHPWFLDLCKEVVPYQIPDEVFSFTDTWHSGRRRSEIAVNIPNIHNPYYSQVFHYFHSNFPQRFFRILGPQRDIPPDARIMGSMERHHFLQRLSESAGFFYPYRDNVCYLPPIEMMQIGGPVIYLAGSLLARFGDRSSPGLAYTEADVSKKVDLLIAGDRTFCQDVIDSQESIRARYDRANVQPKFDEVFTRLLGAAERPGSQGFIPGSDAVDFGSPALVNSSRKLVAIPLHFDGLFHYIDGKPYATEGIPRVVDVVVDALITGCNADILVSCTPASEAVIGDFFLAHLRTGRLRLYTLTNDSSAGEAEHNAAKLSFVSHINNVGSNIAMIFIPHYYLFPEMLLANPSSVMYLPDYFPHVLPEHVFDFSREQDEKNKAVGLALAKKAARILTNSNYTKSYLPEAGFVRKGEASKIIVAPLPVLGQKRAREIGGLEEANLRSRLNGRDFLFYPTANRPNKSLTFFVRLLAHMRLNGHRLCAVLTCDLNSVPSVRESAVHYGVLDELILMPGSTESTMRWLYENTVALCLTSVAEGNFPPQVLEALTYGAPIVATRLPTISEIVVQGDPRLLLCEACNLDDFSRGIELALYERKKVLQKQAELLHELTAWNSIDVFKDKLSEAFVGLDRPVVAAAI